MGRKQECLDVLTFIAKVNDKEKEWSDFQVKNPEVINKIGEKKIEKQNKKSYNIIQILGFPSQRKKIILLCCLWFASGMKFLEFY